MSKSAAELRAELKAIRKEHPDHAPVSKMKKGDIADLIQKLKAGREETPNVASVTNAPSKTFTSAVKSVKKAKAEEFPIELAAESEPAGLKAPKRVMKHKKAAPEMAKMAAKMPKAEAKMPKAEAKKSRPAKGSAEAKAMMDKIRGMKKKAKDE